VLNRIFKLGANLYLVLGVIRISLRMRSHLNHPLLMNILLN